MVIGAAVCGTMGTREKPCTPTFRKDCVIGTVPMIAGAAFTKPAASNKATMKRGRQRRIRY